MLFLLLLKIGIFSKYGYVADSIEIREMFSLTHLIEEFLEAQLRVEYFVLFVIPACRESFFDTERFWTSQNDIFVTNTIPALDFMNNIDLRLRYNTV